uniref:Secreted protein n=1 Tax=Meloidogyne hapla TaxID=6305 RepID=A0A1I8AWU3_MELHA
MFGEYLVILRIMASTVFAFILLNTMAQAQADPTVEADLFLRNMLLRQYLNSRIFGATAGLGIGLEQEKENGDRVSKRSVPQISLESDFPFANSEFWRRRRTPTDINFSFSKRLIRLSDQYTPTPCR